MSSSVCRVQAAESSALRALKKKLYIHRSELMAGFQQYDPSNSGELHASPSSLVQIDRVTLTCGCVFRVRLRQ